LVVPNDKFNKLCIYKISTDEQMISEVEKYSKGKREIHSTKQKNKRRKSK